MYLQPSYMMRFFLFLLILLPFFSSCQSGKTKATNANEQKSWALLPFTKEHSLNPVMVPDSTLVFTDPIWKKSVQWAIKDVFNPAAIVRNDTLFLLFRAEDKIGKHAGVSRIGLAYSTDGYNFTKYPQPVLYPDNDAQKVWEWEGGCEDPRIVQDDKGTYFMTYTAYDGDKARLLVASSMDLRHWTKHGPVFARAFEGKYINTWSKSGAIVSTYNNGAIVATKVGGKYWMYWGDVNIWAATSDDLVNWTPVLYAGGEKPAIELRHNAVEIPEMKIVFGPRAGKFDSDLVEPGPPAMLTESGIVLVYNSRNVPAIGDTSLAEGTYAAGQVLIDKRDPTKVVDRLDNYFIKPDQPYEISGQVAHVCFLEGLVPYKGKWFMYYGTADSKIAVATKDQ